MTGGNQARTPGSDPLSVALLALFPLPLPGRKTGTPSRTHRPMADPEPSGVFFFRIAGTVSAKDRWFVRREISRLRIIHGQPKYLRNKTRNSAVGYCECSLPGTHPPPLPGRTRHPQAGTLARRPSSEPLGIFLSAGRARSTSFRVPGRSPASGRSGPAAGWPRIHAALGRRLRSDGRLSAPLRHGVKIYLRMPELSWNALV